MPCSKSGFIFAHFNKDTKGMLMMNSGFLAPLIIGTVILLMGCGQAVNPGNVACTADARLCPDGSSVGRVAPECNFAPCPVEDTHPHDEDVADDHHANDEVIVDDKTNDELNNGTIDDPQPTQDNEDTPPVQPDMDNTQPDDGTMVEEPRIIEITAAKWFFNPGTTSKGYEPIRVGFEEDVILRITNQDIPHGINIPPLGINEFLPAGTTKDITFTADKKGTFNFSCNIFCGSGHGSMSGTLIVEYAFMRSLISI